MQQPESGMDRRSLSQESLMLIDHRLRQLEAENLATRMLNAENTIAQVKAEVAVITEISKSIGVKMENSMEKIETSSNAKFGELNTKMLHFMGVTKGAMFVFGVIGALIGLGPAVAMLLKAMH
jgi:hypothetical protein